MLDEWSVQLMVLLRRPHARRKCRPPAWGRYLLLRAHDLIAATPDVPDRRAPDVNQPREREDEEDRHTEEQMQLEDRMRVGDECRDIRLQHDDALRPGHELHHLMPVEVPQRDRNGRE